MLWKIECIFPSSETPIPTNATSKFYLEKITKNLENKTQKW